MEFRFNYVYGLEDAFMNSGISTLCNFNDRGWLTGDLASVFVTNHDTEREGSSLSYMSGNVGRNIPWMTSSQAELTMRLIFPVI